MHMYVPCQARFSWLCTCVWLPTVCTAFPWWCIWNQWTDLKDWCWGGHHFKRYRKSFWPSLYCLPRDHNIVRGGLSYTSPANQWKLGLETKLLFQKMKMLRYCEKWMVGKFSRIQLALYLWQTLFWDGLIE